jgi:hypothetical protein
MSCSFKSKKLLINKAVSCCLKRENADPSVPAERPARGNELSELKILQNNNLGLENWVNFETFEGGELNFTTHLSTEDYSEISAFFQIFRRSRGGTGTVRKPRLESECLPGPLGPS